MRRANVTFKAKPATVTLFSIGLLAASFWLSMVLLQATEPAETRKQSPSTTVTTLSKTAAYTKPARLMIPSIGINTRVQPVGITEQGDMAIDESIYDVGWYKHGPKPGEKGSAVIAGHYGWKSGEASVFNEIHTLKKGDKISVIDEQSNAIAFIVKRIQRYKPDADTAGVFTSQDEQSHLNLITCDGTWNESQQTYSERLVVFATREI